MAYTFPYISSNLLKDEKLIFATRPHWIIFSSGISALVIAFLFYCYGPRYFNLQTIVWNGFDLYTVVSALIALVGLYWLLTAYITYRTSEYGVTDKRVLMKRGWIRRDSIEIFLQRLEAINVDQSVSGRIFNYGTIVIIGTGGTQDYYFYVPDPLNFRKRIQQQTDLVIDEDTHHQ